MLDKIQLETLQRQLFADASADVYALLDGASIPGLLEMLAEHAVEHCCLFAGKLHPEVAITAPYLARIEPASALVQALLEHGWGQHWGVYAIGAGPLAFRGARKHFRTFLRVRSPEGRPLLFRYYDPRVLRVYLPTCNATEASSVFGPIRYYVAEGEQPDQLLRFQRVDATGVERVEVALR